MLSRNRLNCGTKFEQKVHEVLTNQMKLKDMHLNYTTNFCRHTNQVSAVHYFDSQAFLFSFWFVSF